MLRHMYLYIYRDPLQNSQSVIRSPDEVVAIAVVDDKKLKYAVSLHYVELYINCLRKVF